MIVLSGVEYRPSNCMEYFDLVKRKSGAPHFFFLMAYVVLEDVNTKTKFFSSLRIELSPSASLLNVMFVTPH